MKHCYYSIFHKDFAYKGLPLYQSLKKWDPDFHLYIFYLHDEVKEFYEKLNLNDATLVNLTDISKPVPNAAMDCINSAVPETLRAMKNWACLYLLKRYPEIEHLVWLDGATFFCVDSGSLGRKQGSAKK